jgi:valyl-tRNA synthetase
MSQLVEQTNDDYENFRLGKMVNAQYDFWKKNLADIYLEAIKPVMKDGTDKQKLAALNTLFICLDFGMRMMHPIMPYVTEELFQRLPHLAKSKPESICIASFPKELKSFSEEKVEDAVKALLDTADAIRSQQAGLNIPSNAKPTICVACTNPLIEKIFEQEAHVLQSLVRSGETIILKQGQAPPDGCLKGFVSEEITPYIKVAGLVDVKS